MKIEVLHSGHALIPMLADRFAGEWPQWAATLDRASLEASFHSAAAGLPLVLGARDGARAIGTVALRPWFGDVPMAETPWIRGLYVWPEWRGRGIDRRLVAAVEAHARRLGFARLYMATTRIERLAARRGWMQFHRLEHEGEAMVWMTRALEPRAHDATWEKE